MLRPQAAGALERVDGVRVTPFWRTVEDCLLRAPFSYGLAIADSALRAKGISRDDLCERLQADCEGRRGDRESVDPFVAERQRESHLTMLGHKVLRFTFDELKNPGKLAEKMRLAGISQRVDLAEGWKASVVWALRGTTNANVVVPDEFVSICNNKGTFGLVTVTD